MKKSGVIYPRIILVLIIKIECVSLHFNLAVWGITLISALAFKFFKNKWQAQRAMKLNRRKYQQLLATREER